jgi:exopolysaccharide biosynthesis predicted pyruvyltransferase EpsI
MFGVSTGSKRLDASNDLCIDSLHEQATRLRKHYREMLSGADHIVVVGVPRQPDKSDASIWLGEKMLLQELGKSPVHVFDYKEAIYELKFALAKHTSKHEVAIMVHGGDLQAAMKANEVWSLLARDFSDLPIYFFPQMVEARVSDLSAQLSALSTVWGNASFAARDQYSFSVLKKVLPRESNSSSWPSLTVLPDASTMLVSRMPRLRVTEKPEVIWRLLLDDEPNQRPAQDLQAKLQELGFPSSAMPAESDSALSFWNKLDARQDISAQPTRDEIADAQLEVAVKEIQEGLILITNQFHAHLLAVMLGQPHVSFASGSSGQIGAYHMTWLNYCSWPFWLCLVKADLADAFRFARRIYEDRYAMSYQVQYVKDRS